jgi:hypothetical protein
MPDKPPKLPPLGFAGFEASSAAAGTGRRKSRWAINPLRDEATATAEAARLSNLEVGVYAGIGRKLERKE